MTNTKSIDVVIAWVDGSDPDLYKKRMRYLNPEQKKFCLLYTSDAADE